jgi:hypothetical protein
MGRRNDLTKVVGAKMCHQQPVQSDIGGRWSYPWADMQPGDVIVVPDPSRRARSALTAAAAQWTRRHGALFATGEVIDPEAYPIVQTGWWCCRVDGVEVLPPDPPQLAEAIAAERQARHEASRLERAREGKTGRIRRQRIEPVRPLVVATEWSQPVAAPAEYADWDKPREPGEVF